MKESQDLEFKVNWQDEYLRIIASFANTDSGKLFIGIDDNGKIVGVEEAKILLETLPNKIRNKLGITPSIHLRQEKNREYLEIDMKPATFPVPYEGKFYIRSGSTTQELTGQELISFLLEKSGSYWDELIEERATIEEVDLSTVEKFINLSKDKIPSIQQEKDWQVVFEKLKLVEKGKIKRAGILIFGKNPQKFYPQSLVKIGRFKSPTEITTHDLIDGNLINQLEQSLNILRTKYLISNIEFEGIQRKEILEYPYDALREAIINALIHRDYLTTTHIQIRVYDDKLVIINEGKLPPDLTVEKLKTEHISKPRNPLLASVFYLAGFIEAWGRGTLKIIEACRNQKLPEPDFDNDSGIMKVIFYKNIYTKENLKKMGLNERQLQAVQFVKENGRITLSEYKKLIGSLVDERTLRRDLNSLVDKNILKPIGEKKGRYYELSK